MDLHLTNKLALITSLTKGIGKAIAAEMTREGTDVIISGRDETEVAKVVKEIQTMLPDTHPQAGAVGISIESQRATLFEKFSKVDVLVNNMGILEPMEYWDIDDATWERFFTVDVLSGNALAKAYLPRIPAQDFGHIIFVINEKAVTPFGEMPQHSMTKAMNPSLVKSLPNSAVGIHVTVNTVMPGLALTEGVEKMLEDMYADSDIPKRDWERDFTKSHRSRSQIQRLIQPGEIGRFVTLVANPDSSSFSGEALGIDGGLVPTIFQNKQKR